MECILCNSQLEGKAAVCSGCAAANLRDDWYCSADGQSGTERLLGMTEVVAVLDGNGYTVALDGGGIGERLALLPADGAGYASVCTLFNEIMEDLGQRAEGGEFVPPPFHFLREIVRKLESCESEHEGGGNTETYSRLAMLYESAALHYRLPYLPEDFITSRKEELLRQAEYWRSRDPAHVDEVKAETAVGISPENVYPLEQEAHPAAGQEVVEAAAEAVPQPTPPGEEEAQTGSQSFDPRVESLRKRIAEIEEELRAEGGDRVTAGAAHAEGGQPAFIRNRRRRGYLHYLSFSFDTALAEIMSIIDEGLGTEHDYALASLLCMRTGKVGLLDRLEESSKTAKLAFDDNLMKAVLDWKDGRWGRALQLAQNEMKKGNFAAGFLLKKSVCEQYSLREKYDELGEESRKVGDIQAGVELLSSVYLSAGTWGAALQVMGLVDKGEWSADMWTNMGMALEEKGDFNGAEEAYAKALELNPILLPAIVRRGMLQCKTGKHQQAFDTLGAARQLQPSILRLQAAELVELGRKEDAMDSLARLLDQDEDDAEAASLGLRLSRELGRPEMEGVFRTYVNRRWSGYGGKE